MARSRIKQITTMGILMAISIILVVSPLQFPFPTAPFLVYEPGDVPILLGGFIFGPASGIVLTVITSVVQSVTVGKDGIFGCIMHILATSALVGISSFIYVKKKTFKRAILGVIFGSFGMTAVMAVLNLALDPVFYGMSFEAVAKLMIPAILPFNLMKAGINSVVFLLIYKSTGRLLLSIVEK